MLFITFVHGWHHSAQPEDGNILSFRKMLGEVSRMEATGSEQQGRKKRKVIGLYIGWRGDSISMPYVNSITFWDRKNTAHDVGQQGVTEVLLRLEEIVNVKIAIGDDNPPPMTSRMVVIGHSFGGAVVYTSLQKVLSDRFTDSRRDKTYQDDAKGFADLVVLMNPAFEAIRLQHFMIFRNKDVEAILIRSFPNLLFLLLKQITLPNMRSLLVAFFLRCLNHMQL